MNWLGGFTRNEERQPREVSRTVAEASSSSQRSDFSMEGKIGLKILCEAQGSADGFGVDVVFVHGLTGNRKTTWTKGNVLWPQTLLPATLPNARIMTFGYDADVVKVGSQASQNRVGNHAENLATALANTRDKTGTSNKPIIFVAHSLGGLVCKYALVKSGESRQPHIRRILDCTRGIAFMGTPHCGARAADWAQILGGLTNLVRRTNQNIIGVLKPDSEVLDIIQGGFVTLLEIRDQPEQSRIEIMCFYEELPIPPLGLVSRDSPIAQYQCNSKVDKSIKVVPQHSATIHPKPRQSIHANHRDMTKFDNPEDPGYEAVSMTLWRWEQALAAEAQSVPEARDQQLLAAVKRGDLAEVIRLLELHATPRAQDESGRTALHWAATKGRTELVRLLLPHSADINATDNQEWTALHCAAQNGNKEIVDMLMKAGSRIEATTESRDTALDIALKHDNHTAAGRLSQWEWTMRRNTLQLPPRLKPQMKPSYKQAQVDNDLALAIQSGDDTKARLALCRHADLNHGRNDGGTPLFWACVYNRPEIIKLLLEQGADIEATNSAGTTPLMRAVGDKRTGLVTLLLDRGADPNAVADSYNTAKDYAVRNRLWGIAKALARKH